jgi:hypothetical protein
VIFVETTGLPVEAASGKATRSVVAALRGGEESKAEGMGKGGWETMERDGKPGSIRRTSVVRQPLFPGETPMRASRRVETLSGGVVTGEGSDWMLLVKHMVWLRTPLSHVRWMLQRGQSFHDTGAGGQRCRRVGARGRAI